MLTTTISSYLPEPGRLILFTVRPTSQGVARLSPVGPATGERTSLESLLLGHQPDRRIVAFDLRGAVDLPALAETLRQWVVRHEALRSGFRVDALGSGFGARRDIGVQRMVLPVSAVAVRADDPIDVTSATTLRAQLALWVERSCDLLTGSPVAFAAIVRPRGTTVLCVADAGTVDSHSLALAIPELIALYHARRGGTSAGLPDAGSFLDHCARHPRRPRPHRDDPTVRAWTQFLRSGGGADPAFPLPLGVAPGHVTPQTADRRMLLDAAAATAFDRRCRLVGGDVHSALLSAVAIAVNRGGGGGTLRVVVPVCTRDERRWHHAVGQFTTMVPVTVPSTVVGGGLLNHVSRTQAAVRAAATHSGAWLPAVLAMAGGPEHAAWRLTPVLRYLDHRRWPGALRHREWNAHLISSVPASDSTTLVVSRTHQGLFLQARYPDTTIATQTMSHFLDTVHDLVHYAVPRRQYTGMAGS